MSNNLVIHSQQFAFADVERMAVGIAKSGLFGVKTPEQALALMLVAQAEGRHPASAARDYDIIQNRPSKKAEAMMRDFLANGGKVEWHKLDDAGADATFSHPQGGSVRITWDMDRAKKAGLGGKDMWSKYPRQMFRSRCVSEGVRTVFPMATSGMYVPEEEADIDRPMKDITPTKAAHPEPKKPLGENPFKAPSPPAEPETLGEVLDGLPQPPAPPPNDLVKAEWTAWLGRAKAEIGACKTLDEMTAWKDANTQQRQALAAYSPKTANNLANMLAAKERELMA